MRKQQLDVLLWPANSPDLNVLGYCIWGILDAKVAGKMKSVPPTEAALKVAIQDANAELDQAVIKKAARQ